MVKYITKEQANEIFDNAYYSAEDMPEFRYYFETFMGCATSLDVIERSKINKAIDELQNMKVYDRTRTARLVSLPEVLDILKRNIGEIENE